MIPLASTYPIVYSRMSFLVSVLTAAKPTCQLPIYQGGIEPAEEAIGT